MTDILSPVLIHRCPSLREEAQLHSFWESLQFKGGGWTGKPLPAYRVRCPARSQASVFLVGR